MPSRSPTDETLTLDYEDGWVAVNRLIRQGLSWSGREMDCAYWNAGDGTFIDVSNTLGLDWKGDGRSFVQVDWDGDGDLDLWLASRTAPQVQFLRNDAAAAPFLRLRLEGAGPNTEAIGARVEVRAGGRLLVQERRLGGGYLAQSSEWLHFGLGDVESIESVRVRWPGGPWQAFTGLAMNGRYLLRQGEPEAAPAPGATREVRLATSKSVPVRPPASARVVITRRLPLPALEAQGFEGEVLTTRGPGPRLVSFWASWCPNCIKELHLWRREAARFEELGLEVLALSVDEDPEAARAFWSSAGLPFQGGLAPERWVLLFDLLQRLAVDRQRDMAVPTSFLLDADGRIATIYRGPVDTEVVAADVRALADQAPAFGGLPFEGRQLGAARSVPLVEIQRRLLDQERPDEALFYIDRACEEAGPRPGDPSQAESLANALTRVGADFLSKGRVEDAERALSRAIEWSPADSLAWFGLARARVAAQDSPGAVAALEQAVELDPSFALAWDLLGSVRLSAQELDAAREALRSALAIDPRLVGTWQNLGIVELSAEDHEAGAAAFRRATELAPQSADAWTGLGMCLVQAGDTEPGVAALERALQLDPRNARALAVMKQLGRR